MMALRRQIAHLGLRIWIYSQWPVRPKPIMPMTIQRIHCRRRRLPALVQNLILARICPRITVCPITIISICFDIRRRRRPHVARIPTPGINTAMFLIEFNLY